MNLRLRRCAIRDWSPEDAASLALHANNREIWRNLRDRFPHPYTQADAEGWISFARQAVPETNFALSVDGVAVGGIGLELQPDVFRRTAEVGYWLGEPYWGRGIVTEALGAFSAWAFEHFNLVRLQAGVFAWNEASMRVLGKAGYTWEGRLRATVWKDGHLTDLCIYAMLHPSGSSSSG